MNRKKKLLMNTYFALIYQVITIVSGFVLPLFVIPYFGSTTNGLISSITQFLTVITLCECGVGAVVQSALYKALAKHDHNEISKILASSNRFFNNIMKILGGYIILLIIIYPFLLSSKYQFSYLYTSSLIVILAFSYIAQYYLFLTYRLLLNADQMGFVQLFIHSIVLILNTVFTVILIKLGSSVHIVKLVSAFVFLIQPIFLKKYVNKNYDFNLKIEYTEEPIKQKWNGMAQHVANVILENTDTVVLTAFSSLENVSIYGVYYLVVHGIRQIIVSFSAGIQSLLGNMLANKEMDVLIETISYIEIMFHWIVTLLFTLTGLLIIPFIKIYTADFNDLNYQLPVFAILMVLAQAVYCIRIPYETVIKAAGHYKETQTSSVIEAAINIIVSILLVIILPSNMKLIGVVIGTICAMSYRTIYLVLYLEKNIIYREIKHFLVNIFTDFIVLCCMLIATVMIPKFSDCYLYWVASATINGVVCFVISFAIYYLVYKKQLISAIKMFKR